MCKRKYQLSQATIDTLVSPEQAKAQENSAKKDAKANKAIDFGLEIFKLGSNYWRNVLEAGSRYNKFTDDYNSYQNITEAIKACEKNRLIYKKEIINNLMRIKSEFEEEGIITKVEIQFDEE